MDIVERLRNDDRTLMLADEAADEIERLRGIIAEYEKTHGEIYARRSGGVKEVL